jgi:hypothetical protein
MSSAFWIVTAHTVLIVALGSAYFRRYEVARPPIGVLNLRDVAVIFGGIVVMPYAYLSLPTWAAGALLTGIAMTVVYIASEPVLRRRGFVWTASLGLIVADVAAAVLYGTASNRFLAVNNVVLVVAVVGVANLLAQGGMKARDVAVLGGALTVYDAVATLQLTLMTDLLQQLGQLPLAPFVGWSEGDATFAIGVGDLLLATLFPLVLRRAYGRRAALVGAATAVGVLTTLVALGDTGIVTVAIPAMTILGPLMVVQYAVWRLRCGRERTTRAYLSAEPLGRPDPAPARSGLRRSFPVHRAGRTTPIMSPGLAETSLEGR